MAESNPQLRRAGTSSDDPSATARGADQTIAQAAQAVGVSPSTIRLWERQGLIRVRRTAAGHRRFGWLEIERMLAVRAIHEERRTPVYKLVVPLPPAPSSEVSWRRPASQPNQVGLRISQVRWQLQLSLRELGRRAHVSASHLSSIERGHAQASIAALQKVTTALGVTMATLLGDAAPERTLVRSQEGNSSRVNARGVEIVDLAPTAKLLEPQLFTLAPGASSGGYSRHEGEEFIHVLQGCLELWVEGGERYRAETGDSLCFASARAHRWRNPGRRPTRLIWVNTPRSF
ncbi:MAG: hypothetical protein DLM67_02135 [Candidatus Nephthysia bennettiae]|uniref:Cupin domain-containing protein n=1 Tax=Candidatus Nephthysia bennettiae TaxID=3127016 RepID=A0A934K602_9BACT|nr:cupin domain-containing protein [Candidatus Dormibacteraeota bacterium]MBJ7613636.1 cupin domain-containing protein [Candidatus Dormibacteraeota bacterium]PZS00144.1 MAG: hypothetical protein DLM67_02135 [Candidatus Dormibacteraeota bacterium]